VGGWSARHIQPMLMLPCGPSAGWSRQLLAPGKWELGTGAREARSDLFVCMPLSDIQTAELHKHMLPKPLLLMLSLCVLLLAPAAHHPAPTL
jgi:hypothetical protein